LRFKEQETGLILQEHDDDDDTIMYIVMFITVIQYCKII